MAQVIVKLTTSNPEATDLAAVAVATRILTIINDGFACQGKAGPSSIEWLNPTGDKQTRKETAD